MDGTFGFCFSSINLYNRSLVFACSCSCFRVSCYNKKSIGCVSRIKLPLTAYCAFIYCMLCFACVNSAVIARRLSVSALTFLFAELHVTEQIQCHFPGLFFQLCLLHFGFQLDTLSPALIQFLSAFFLDTHKSLYTTLCSYSLSSYQLGFQILLICLKL